MRKVLYSICATPVPQPYSIKPSSQSHWWRYCFLCHSQKSQSVRGMCPSIGASTTRMSFFGVLTTVTPGLIQTASYRPLTELRVANEKDQDGTN